ncbi:MAG: sensory box protein [Verrucomicrobiaceae bacterium]|nr:sensory box protein [Verrucomicrobiaceae bacterium]
MMTANTQDMESRVATLIRTLFEAEQELRALTGGQLDVVTNAEGAPYLLLEAQERLRGSEAVQRQAAETHAAILNALPAHLALIDPAGMILTVNESWRRFALANAAQNPASRVGENHLEMCESATGTYGREGPSAAVGIRQVLRGETKEFIIEYSCHSNIEQRWFRLMVSPFGEDRLVGAVVVHLDITTRMLAEQALRLNEERFRQLSEQLSKVLDSSLDAICAFDAKGRFIQVSAACEKIWGYSPDELMGTAYMDKVHPQDQSKTRDAAVEIMAGKPTISFENRYVRKDGAITYVVWSAWWSEGDQNMFCVARDNTERRKLEEQFLRAQRMESIGTLAGGIAHDLNNMLAPIMMSIALLKLQETDHQRLDILTTIEGSAKRGAEMVKQVLSFAQGVTGQQLEVQIAPLLAEVAKIVNDTFLKNIRVSSEIPMDLWTVQGDPTQLHQVLVNLCVNARDAMPLGGSLRLSASNLMVDEHYAGMNIEARPGPYLVIQVEDTGTGMPPEVIDKIFEPFFTTKEVGKGTGLGLSTTLAIVKSHGGFVRVYSEPGAGTKFRVYLPAQTVRAEGGDDAPAKIDLPRGNGELVLVVDDEASVRQITQQTLLAFGYRVLLASDGVEATALYAVQRADVSVVLTDMMMPLMDGPTTIQVLMRMNPQVRIIAASGLNANGMVAKAASAGVMHFLPKPYTAETMLQALHMVLRS